MEKLPDPTYIKTAEQLSALVLKLDQQPIIGVDTESNSLFAYRERVCLIQFSFPGEDFLVDPLEIEDLSPLNKIFSNPEIIKIFHAAEYDILTMRRDFSFAFSNIFDTMLAARIVGRKKVGYGSLVLEEFGIAIEKKFQRADWGKRPISKDMQSYARLDTHYLLELRKKLLDQLINKDRLPIADEDFLRLCNLNGSAPEPIGVNIWRINGVKDLNPEECAVLQRLAEYRQNKAEQLDRPLFKVIGDKTLLAIAGSFPNRKEDLSMIQGMTPKLMRWHAKGLFNAFRTGLEDPPLYPPRRPRMSEDQADRYEILRNWRKNRAKKIDVESDVILPKNIMLEISLNPPNNMEELQELMQELPWRFEQYSGEIFKKLST
ncbi:MAG: ribonuclease D [Chloroflexi bacterium]|nr:ribonuclease D [Chloroflexota bacterium]MBT3671015.1 ribonuclease D [Chloroflexota bacterium]MBT4533859.1 ribonuclease D [Chloroflexota bacterium]MBT4681941.1 ribonuclease D [Chloroflexota bacterium]MBT4755916.1 ribonuclease D [Chloroflexota bacterium]